MTKPRSVLCKCGGTRGLRFPDGGYEVRHAGRRVRGTGTVYIDCEACGFTICDMPGEASQEAALTMPQQAG